MNDNDNTFAKILIADSLLSEQKARSESEKHRALNEQSLRNQEEIQNLQKKNQGKFKELESKISTQAGIIYRLKQQNQETLDALLNRSYNNIYHQSMLYGARFLLLDLANQINLPENILIKISILSTHKYMTNPNDVPSNLSNYIISYSSLLKEKNYEHLLAQDDWKTSYEKRLYKTIRDARGEIAQYVLSQNEINPLLSLILPNLDARFSTINDTKKMLEEILSEQLSEKQASDLKEAGKQEKIRIEKERIEKLLLWAKEEKSLLEHSNIVIHQEQPIDNLFNEHQNKNYYWIPLLKFLSKAKIEFEINNTRNLGNFLSSKKESHLKLKINIETGNNSDMGEMGYHSFSPLIINTLSKTKATSTFEEELNAQYYSFGWVPHKTKIEHVDMFLEIHRKDENDKFITTVYPFKYILKKPFIVS